MTRIALGLVTSIVLLAGCDGGESSEPTVYRGDEMLDTGMTIKQTVETRQHNFKDLGGAYKTINDQLATGDPVLQEIKYAADEVARHANDMTYWFPEGTGPDSGVETDALAKIWEAPDAFAAELASFKPVADAMKAAADAENVEEMGPASRALGGGCKSCHDAYRLDD